MIFGASLSKLQEKFISSAANLLFFWRDETAHGQISTVSEIEAFHSLTALVRFAQFPFRKLGIPYKNRNPLKALIGFTQLLIRGARDPRFSRCLRAARQAAS
jgi:hypothetical protein